MYEIKVYNTISTEGHALEVKVFPYEQYEIRVAWDAAEEKYFFSIVDVVGLLTEQPTVERARNYWKVLKLRLKKEGNETVTNCNQLNFFASDGKRRLTDLQTPNDMCSRWVKTLMGNISTLVQKVK